MLNLHERGRSNDTNTSEKYRFFDFVQKPIEMYIFLDPLCSDCWSLDPYLKKFSLEYGRFFTTRQIISNHLSIVNQKNTDDPFTTNNNHDENETVTEKLDKYANIYIHSISMAIKAAELQGKNAGRVFLRKIQEKFFIQKRDVSNVSTLLHCALEANLDIDEFVNDLNSVSAQRASQCDLKITKEMKVHHAPTIVFFNQQIEEDGVKISGINAYDIYVLILTDMLQMKPIPAKKPDLEDYVAKYQVVSDKEIAIVYDLTIEEAKRELGKLQLKRKVKKEIIHDEVFWKYNV